MLRNGLHTDIYRTSPFSLLFSSYVFSSFLSPPFSSAGSSADPFPDLFALGPKGEIRPESEQHYPEEEPFISDGRAYKYRPAGAEGETRIC